MAGRKEGESLNHYLLYLPMEKAFRNNYHMWLPEPPLGLLPLGFKMNMLLE
jgi:hypothetical protein